LRDDPALSHAGRHHAARAGEQDQDGAIEARVEARDQLADRCGLDLQHLAGRVARHCRQS
jgi:hypothetical protein